MISNKTFGQKSCIEASVCLDTEERGYRFGLNYDLAQTGRDQAKLAGSQSERRSTCADLSFASQYGKNLNAIGPERNTCASVCVHGLNIEKRILNDWPHFDGAGACELRADEWRFKV